MNATIFEAILTKLSGDATLTSYIGSNRVFRAQRVAPAVLPAVTVRIGSETATNRPCYNIIKSSIPGAVLTDKRATAEIHVWISSAKATFPNTGEDAELIADYIEQLLMDASTPVTGTRSWAKTSDGSPQHEDDMEIWHQTTRFSFEYERKST